MCMLVSKCQRQEFLIDVRQVLTYLIQADWFIMFIIHFIKFMITGIKLTLFTVRVKYCSSL